MDGVRLRNLNEWRGRELSGEDHDELTCLTIWDLALPCLFPSCLKVSDSSFLFIPLFLPNSISSLPGVKAPPVT
jgi:hypothetical protein